MSIFYLTGFMGAGKSTVAKALAQVLGCQQIDLDELISEKAGLSISDIFAEFGETYFRDIETETLGELESADKLVVATGGGCVERESNRAMMQNSGKTIYLQTSWEEILKRISGSSHRPLALNEDNWGKTRELLRKRLPLYETADITVDTNGKDPDEISREIITRLDV